RVPPEVIDLAGPADDPPESADDRVRPALHREAQVSSRCLMDVSESAEPLERLLVLSLLLGRAHWVNRRGIRRRRGANLARKERKQRSAEISRLRFRPDRFRVDSQSIVERGWHIRDG